MRSVCVWHLIFPNSWQSARRHSHCWPFSSHHLSCLPFTSLSSYIPSHHFTLTSFPSSFPPFPNLVLHQELHREHQLHYPTGMCICVCTCACLFTHACTYVFQHVCGETAQSGHWLFMTMLISCHFASAAQEVSKMTRELTYSLWLAPQDTTATYTHTQIHTHTLPHHFTFDIPRWCLHLSKYFPMMNCLNSFSHWNHVLG